mmetsp:Transcript_115822/g.300262  ORF Transcript_115822/g.300262 Transcript_115822/m.300262 type:complete len:226 (-) Transcript_115822:753-1430(-)
MTTCVSKTLALAQMPAFPVQGTRRFRRRALHRGRHQPTSPRPLSAATDPFACAVRARSPTWTAWAAPTGQQRLSIARADTGSLTSPRMAQHAATFARARSATASFCGRAEVAIGAFAEAASLSHHRARVCRDWTSGAAAVQRRVRSSSGQWSWMPGGSARALKCCCITRARTPREVTSGSRSRRGGSFRLTRLPHSSASTLPTDTAWPARRCLAGQRKGQSARPR